MQIAKKRPGAVIPEPFIQTLIINIEVEVNDQLDQTMGVVWYHYTSCNFNVGVEYSDVLWTVW